MFRADVPIFLLSRFLATALLLALSTAAAAQHHGGHGMGGSMPGGMSRPGGVEEKDTLKDFHQALAVQATSPQIAEFQEAVKVTNAAKDKLTAFAEPAEGAARDGVTLIDQALENSRSREQKFQAGFSEAQKSGLKEITKRLEKADSELEFEAKRFDQTIQLEAAKAEISSRAASLEKALTVFADEQLALGREMGITLASAQDLTFNLPAVKRPLTIATKKIVIASGGTLSQTEAAAGFRTFRLELISDLSDLQPSVTGIMTAAVDSGSSCGERLAVRSASLMPASPSGSLVLQLHYERWACSRPGQSMSTEIAEQDGSVELNLTPAFDKSHFVTIDAQFKRIDASGMMADSLRTGDLGVDLRDKVAKSVLIAVQAAADLKTNLPEAVQGGATLQTARFQDAGPGILGLVLEGQVKVTNEQVNLLATQLNQTLSAQGTPPQ